MATLIDFTRPDKAHWPAQPRYAVIFWPLLPTLVTSYGWLRRTRGFHGLKRAAQFSFAIFQCATGQEQYKVTLSREAKSGEYGLI